MDAKELRAANKAKANRMAGGRDEVPGATTWRPDEPMNADVKTGMRPVSRRQFKRGGAVKVDGDDAKHHAGRPARACGGKTVADAIVNRDQKEANEEREGKKHVGGMAKGGRAKKNIGGPTGLYGAHTQPTGKTFVSLTETKKKANGGIVLNDTDIRRTKGYPLPDSHVENGPKGMVPVKEETAVKRTTGVAPAAAPASSSPGGPPLTRAGMQQVIGLGKNFEGMTYTMPSPLKKTAAAPAAAPAVAATKRAARQDGGRVAGKGKTNINIIIAPQGGAKQAEQPPVPPPMPKPPMPAPAMPAAAAPAPMPGPPAGLAAALGSAGGHPGGTGVAPPIMRKDGGAVKMDAGAGSGLGRLEKIKKYGDNARP